MKKPDFATNKIVDISKPEEIVRQNYEKELVEDYEYKKEQIDIEVPIQRGSSHKERADIVIYKSIDQNHRQQSQDILAIVETKRKHRKDGIEQCASYMSATSASWGVWTNGQDIVCLVKKHATGEIYDNLIFQIPRCGNSIESVGSLSWNDLKPPRNLKITFRRILNNLYTNTNISRRDKLGNEMIKLLFCKIYDEKYKTNNSFPLFYVRYQEKKEDASTRIKQLFKSVKDTLRGDGVFDENEEIVLDDKSISSVVGELQSYSLLSAETDVIGDAFEVFAESKFVGEKGEFFTPRQIVKIALKLVKPNINQTVFDPACGSGGFLIYALSYLWQIMEKKYSSMSRAQLENERIRMALKLIYGIDKEVDLVKIAKAYMSIIGDGKSNIACQNTLHSADEFRGRAKEIFVQDGKLKKFDVILTNPPFGSKNTKVLISEARNFDLGHKWKLVGTHYSKTNIPQETPAQELFIERALQMLNDGGRLAIVLPETYFHAPTKKHILQYIKEKGAISAVVDVPHNAFRPFCNAKTCLLVFEKGTAQGDIVFVVCEEIGSDHLGQIKYRINNDGTITDTIWDDTDIILNELNNPCDANNTHVFVKNAGDIINNIYVPRYYWDNTDWIDKANNMNCYVKKLGDLVEEGHIEVFRGHGSPANPYKGQGTIPYVRAGDIGNMSVYKNPVSSVPEFVYHAVKGKNGVDLQKGDIIFVKEGSYRIGDIAFILESDTKILLNSHCLVLRVTSSNEYNIDCYYLSYLLSCPFTLAQTRSKIFIDTTLPNIGNRWRELLIPISRDTQEIEQKRKQMKAIFDFREKSESLIQSLHK